MRNPLTSETQKQLRREVRQQTTTYILAGFGFVAGLAWNEAIKGLIEYAFPAQGDGVWAKLIYAFGITLIVVLVTFFVHRADRGERQ